MFNFHPIARLFEAILFSNLDKTNLKKCGGYFLAIVTEKGSLRTTRYHLSE